MAETILEVKDLSRNIDNGTTIFSNISFNVKQGDILILMGRSGSGKSTLLKCIAHLVLHSGECLYRGSTPGAYGITSYRTKILYVPQRPSLLSGSPQDFLTAITSLNVHKSKSHSRNQSTSGLTLDSPLSQQPIDDVFERAHQVAEAWEIDRELWTRTWGNLSGGESQRILLASAVALDTAEVLLLDEPTSALDSETVSLVEDYLMDRVKRNDTSLKAIIWITHSTEQGRRVGTRFVHLSAGGCIEIDDPNSVFDSSSTPREPRSQTPSIVISHPT